jgi:hypothetical protein
MHGSIVFPILSLAGDVLGMYGRKITPAVRSLLPEEVGRPPE